MNSISICNWMKYELPQKYDSSFYLSPITIVTVYLDCRHKEPV